MKKIRIFRHMTKPNTPISANGYKSLRIPLPAEMLLYLAWKHAKEDYAKRKSAKLKTALQFLEVALAEYGQYWWKTARTRTTTQGGT